jgi:predicted LppA-like lipoprotein
VSIVKRLALALLVVLAVAGCEGNEVVSEFEGDEQQQRAELMRRPSLEDASARYQEMLARMRNELTTSFPWMNWRTSQGLTRAGCAEFKVYKEELETHYLGVWVAYGDLSDADWPRAQQVIADIGRSYGFGEPRIMSDRPGNHEITALDQYGASYSIGAGHNIAINGSTGCHLPQAVKDRIAATGR